MDRIYYNVHPAPCLCQAACGVTNGWGERLASQGGGDCLCNSIYRTSKPTHYTAQIGQTQSPQCLRRRKGFATHGQWLPAGTPPSHLSPSLDLQQRCVVKIPEHTFSCSKPNFWGILSFYKCVEFNNKLWKDALNSGGIMESIPQNQISRLQKLLVWCYCLSSSRNYGHCLFLNFLWFIAAYMRPGILSSLGGEISHWPLIQWDPVLLHHIHLQTSEEINRLFPFFV